MPKQELGEPLLDDGRLQHVATRLLAEFPQLLAYDPDFVTWVQEPKEIVSEDGLVTRLPEVGVFGVMSNGKLTKGAFYLNAFETEDNYDPTAALRIYRAIVREHLRILTNLEGLQDEQIRTIRGSDV